MIVRLAVLVTCAKLAEILALVCALTGWVLMLNVAILCPAGMVTLAPGLAALELLESVMLRPPVGAGPVSVTVPVLDAPPTRLVGLKARLLSTGALTVRAADLLLVPREAVMRAVL